ncbi:MAG: DoxX family protein [Balneolales bacterium]|nr:DoxX family protein [Balneolales bacterium]
MPAFFLTVLILNALFFVFYGVQSLVSKWMIAEFKRFGLNDAQRKVTGVLQLLGAGGLFLGISYPPAGALAAAGFSVMMLVAFLVRLSIKDSVLLSLPSLVFLFINLYLTAGFLAALR